MPDPKMGQIGLQNEKKIQRTCQVEGQIESQNVMQAECKIDRTCNFPIHDAKLDVISLIIIVVLRRKRLGGDHSNVIFSKGLTKLGKVVNWY